jgi:diguanylate cyclase (GGDEF)-like protein/PAS domain S-box-containing protein
MSQPLPNPGPMSLVLNPLQDLPQSVRALRAAIDAMPVGVSWAGLQDGRIRFINRKFTEIFGYLPGEFESVQEWVERTYPYADDRALVAEVWGRFLAGKACEEEEIRPIETRIRCRDGAIKTVLTSGIVMPEQGWALATFVDISERKQQEERLQAAERRAAENEAIFRLLLDHSRELTILSPFDESRRYVSAAVEEITGFTPEEYLTIKPLDTFHPEDRDIAERVLAELRLGNLRHEFRYRIQRKDGGYRWVEALVTGYRDPVTLETEGYIATVRDIAEEMEREARLAGENRVLTQVATEDDLTGIPNRRAFNRAMASEVSRHNRQSREVSLMMIDVDSFKKYNDIYGHLAGDACLRTIAGALRQCIRRDGDLVARYGGEEFVVLMPATELDGAKVVAEQLLGAVRALEIGHAGSGHKVVTVSIGVATWPAGVAFDPTALIERADKALYQAKAMGRNGWMEG